MIEHTSVYNLEVVIDDQDSLYSRVLRQTVKEQIGLPVG